MRVFSLWKADSPGLMMCPEDGATSVPDPDVSSQHAINGASINVYKDPDFHRVDRRKKSLCLVLEVVGSAPQCQCGYLL